MHRGPSAGKYSCQAAENDVEGGAGPECYTGTRQDVYVRERMGSKASLVIGAGEGSS